MSLFKTKIKGVIYLLIIISGTLFAYQETNAQSTPKTRQIDFSAYLVNNSNKEIENGTYEIRFAIYDQKEGGSPVWQETQDVKITDGIMNAYLGSKTPLPSSLTFNDRTYYLGIKIRDDSEMAPRKKIESVPEAINSQYLQGKTIGTQEGDITIIGKGGKLDVNLIPQLTDLGIIGTGTWEGDPIDTKFGGTNLTSYKKGDMLYANTTDKLANLNIGASGQFLGIDNGLPSWQTIDLSAPGEITNGTWHGDTIETAFGGTGTNETFTEGSLVFAGPSGVYLQDNANLFWDDTDNRLGVGTTNPQTKLHIQGGTLYVDNQNPALAGSYNTDGYAMDAYVSGNYLYVADVGSGLQIIDISDPANPVLTGNYPASSNAYGVFVVGNYAYVADGWSGLQIIDVSNPSSPALVGFYDISDFAYEVFVSGSYAYVASGNDGLQIVDISNLANPVLAGSYDTDGYANEVFVSGNYAYLTDSDYGLQIFDVSDPADPILVGSYDTNGYAYGIYVSGNYAYISDAGEGLQIIDISDSENPYLVGSYDTYYTEGVDVSGNYAYVADYNSGLKIINITDPSNPTLFGSFDTPDYALGVHISGNYAYVADYESGLQIIDINKIGGINNYSLYVSNGSAQSYFGSDAIFSSNIGIGIEVSKNRLDVAGGVVIGSSYAGVETAPSDGLIVQGRLGIGTATPNAPLQVVEYINFGNSSTTVGYRAGFNNSGSANTFIGNSAGYSNTTGSYNVATSNALGGNGDHNSAIGFWSLINNQTGSNNVAMGYFSLGQNSTGNSNVAIGNSAGSGIQNGSNNTFIGANSNGFGDITNATAIGYNAQVAQSNSLILGGTGEYAVNVGIGTSSPTEKLHIQDGGIFIDNPEQVLTSTLLGMYDTPGEVSKVFVDGDYVYVADGSAGLQIIDISDPADPSLTANYDTTGYAQGIYVSNSYAYVADGTLGLRVIDVDNPSNPILVGTYPTAGNAVGIFVDGGYAYVADTLAGLKIVDISNPASPTLAGTYAATSAMNVYVSGDYAYVADYYSGLKIINISNPASPTLAGNYILSGVTSSIFVSDDYAYVTNWGSGLQIIDISNPANLWLTGSYDTSGFAREVYVSGNYAYIADGYSVQIIDIANPTDPALAGSYDTAIGAVGIAVSGDYAYVADENTGLKIISVVPSDGHALYVADGSYSSYFGSNVGIGTETPISKLDINGDLNMQGISAPDISLAGQGKIYFDSTLNKFQVSENGGSYFDLVVGSDLKTLQAQSTVNLVRDAILRLRADTGKWPNLDGSTIDCFPTVNLLFGDGNWPGNAAAQGYDGLTGSYFDSYLSEDGSDCMGENWKGSYFDHVGVDPWGNAYVSNVDDFTTTDHVWIISAGPDGIMDTNVADTVLQGDDVGVVISGYHNQWLASDSDIYFNTGNVGIGTDSPTSNLSVVSSGEEGVINVDSSAYTRVLFSHGGTRHGEIQSVYDGASSSISVVSDGINFAKLDSTSLMSILENGNVGIGIDPSSNSAKLSIASDVSLDSTVYFNSESQIMNISSSAVSGDLVYVAGSRGATAINGLVMNFGETPTDFTGKFISLISGSTERSFINSTGGAYFAGSVGIGTTSPNSNLEIRGTGLGAGIRIGSSATSGDGVGAGSQTISFGTYIDGVYTQTAVMGDTSGADYKFKLFATQGDIHFGSNIGGTASTRMVINTSGGVTIGGSDLASTTNMFYADGSISDIVVDTSGKMGIGTTSPSSKFDVHGSGTTTGVNVQFADSTGAAKFTVLDNGMVGLYNASSPTLGLMVGTGLSGGAAETIGAYELRVANIYGQDAQGAYARGGLNLQYGVAYPVAVGSYDGGSSLLVNGSITGNATEVPLLTLKYRNDTKLLVNYNGNVGIGTTNPGAKLEVAGNGKIRASGSSAGNYVQMWYDDAVGNKIETSNDLLYIFGSSGAMGELSRTSLLQNGDASGDHVVGINGGTRILYNTNTGLGGVVQPGNYDLYFATNNSERMRLSKTGGLAVGSSAWNGTDPGAGNVIIQGNVGIGTTSPGYKLDVNGGVAATTLVTSGLISAAKNTDYQAIFSGYSTVASSSSVFNGSIALGTNPAFRGIIDFYAGTPNLSIENTYDNTSSAINFRMRTAGTAPISAMTILGSGNVGIGTTAPTSKLQVSLASGESVTLGGFKVVEAWAYEYWSQGTKFMTMNAGTANADFLGKVSALGGSSYGFVTSNASLTSETVLGSGGSTGAKLFGYDGIQFENRGYYGGPITFSMNSAEKVRITTTGNVGIGTTSPQSLLQLDNGGTFTLAKGLTFGDGDSGFYEYADDNLRVGIAGNSRWVFDSGYFGNTSGTGGWLNQNSVTATYPGLVPYSNDQDTGIGRADENILSFISGGTNVMNVTSGNVGIGTISPEQKLDVAGTLQMRRLADADAGNTTRNSNSLVLNGAYWNGSTSTNINWTISNSVPVEYGSDLTISGGYSNLAMKFVTRTNSQGIEIGSPSSRTDNTPYLNVQGNIYTGMTAGLLPNNGGAASLKFINSGNDLSLTGNVGIGTTSPGYKLDVNGVGAFRDASLSVSTNDPFTIQNIIDPQNTAVNSVNLGFSGSHRLKWVNIFEMKFDGVGSLTAVPNIIMSGSSINLGNGPYITGQSGQVLDFNSYHGVTVQNNSGNVARFGMSSSSINSAFYGNVGIGTTSPNNTLSVVGSICADNGTSCAGTAPGYIYAANFVAAGTQLSVPDYVFESTYDLLPLSNLKDYLTINKHLPNIPSMLDIQQNGLNYSSMLMGLLEKTEENTLYIINTDERLTGLNLQTEKNITNIQDLQDSINTQLGTVETSLISLDQQLTINNSQLTNLESQMSDVKGQVLTLESLTQTIQTQIQELQNKEAINTAYADLFKTILDIDPQGKTNIFGIQKFTSEITETGQLIIKNNDPQKKTIGEAIIPAGQTSVIVETGAVSGDSKIFTNFENNPNAYSWTEKISGGSGDYTGFNILLSAPAISDVNINWWIVESK